MIGFLENLILQLSVFLNRPAKPVFSFTQEITCECSSVDAELVGNNAKGRISNGYFKKTNQAKFSKKTNISYPLTRILLKNNKPYQDDYSSRNIYLCLGGANHLHKLHSTLCLHFL